MATCCDEAPAPTSEPLTAALSEVGASVEPVPPSFAAQPASARAATAPMAPIRAIREIFTVDPSIWNGWGPVQGTQ